MLAQRLEYAINGAWDVGVNSEVYKAAQALIEAIKNDKNL